MRRAHRRRGGDEGFTLVEIVVAVVLLGFLAVAILPAIIMGLEVAASQGTKATAVRAANSVIEAARAEPTCAGIAAAAAPRTVTDGRGDPLRVVGALGDCAAGRTVSLTVTVTPAGSPEAIAILDALILVR